MLQTGEFSEFKLYLTRDSHNTYFYTEEVKIMFQLKIAGKNLLHIQGGENYFQNNFTLPDFGSVGADVCGAFQLNAVRAD